jgi:hypothetical protein
MLRRLLGLALVSTALVAPNALHATPGPRQAPRSLDHVSWVAQVLQRIETIKPGMTREDLLKVFMTEGGLSTGLQRTFVSRDCPYFKVDVQFKAVGRPGRDGNGRVTLQESSQDRILQISRPYLQFRISD